MFNKIVLRRGSSGGPISHGQLAEAMMYYQNVHIIFDVGTVQALVKAIGTDLLIALLQRQGVTAVYCDEMLGTRTEGIGATQTHTYVGLNITGTHTGKTLKNAADRIEYNLQSIGISIKASRKFVTQFLDMVPLRKYSNNSYLAGGIIEAANKDLLDCDFLNSAAKRILEMSSHNVGLDDGFKFEVIQYPIGHIVYTSRHIDLINEYRKNQSSLLEPITTAQILTNILDARADLTLASFYGGDFSTSDCVSGIIQIKHSELLRRLEINDSERKIFNEVVFENAPSIKEVIDSGERSFDEFLKILDKARHFKNWMNNVGPDENLIRNYLRDARKESWIESTKGKVIRYVFTAVMDKFHPVAGMVAGIADTFLFEKLIAGWRPNHFVDKTYLPFVKREHNKR